MTVWIVNPFDNLPTEGCRPQRYWLMAEAFRRAGHTVVYWTSDFSHARKAKRKKSGRTGGESGRTAEFEVVEIPTRPYPKNVCWARIGSHRQLARDFLSLSSAFLRGSDSPPALVIASTPPLGLCDAARRVARSCGAKFVCDIQDAWPETFGRLLPRGLKWLGALLFAPLRRTARRLYREADFVTGVSARYAQVSGRGDFHLAYHGIAASPADAESSPLQNGDGSLRPRRGGGAASTGRSPRRLVYIGNLGEGYDLDTVLDAVAKRASLTLDVAGLGPREAPLRAHAAARHLEDRVRFHGYLRTAELEDLLARCDVGLIPMRDDSWVGLPYKLCDYLKAGLPVLSSLHGECGDLLRRTGFGRVYARGDSDSLLRALDDLPRRPVSLPDELRAERIYAHYAERLCHE